MAVQLAPPAARTLFDRMRSKRILVVGDVMIDEWIWGRVSRISPEAPVPVVEVSDHSFTLGGAGNVANNLRALEAAVSFVSAIGTDSFAGQIREMLRAEQVDDASVITVQDRPTTRKTRIVAHNQQVVRADWESSQPLSEADRAVLCAHVRKLAATCDAVILSDYAKGLLGREIVEAALGDGVAENERAHRQPLVLADPKPGNLDLFVGVTCVAPNAQEASAATGISIVDDATLEAAGSRLLERLQCKYVVITRGEHGMALFGRDGERSQIPSVARTVFDVSGAGDTVIAVLSLALAAAAPAEQAMQLANFAAGAVIEKLGTATATADEIIALVEHERA